MVSFALKANEYHCLSYCFRKWQNEKEGPEHSSSDEEEEDDEDKDEDVIRRPLRLPKTDVRMEVDVNDSKFSLIQRCDRFQINIWH